MVGVPVCGTTTAGRYAAAALADVPAVNSEYPANTEQDSFDVGGFFQLEPDWENFVPAVCFRGGSLMFQTVDDFTFFGAGQVVCRNCCDNRIVVKAQCR